MTVENDSNALSIELVIDVTPPIIGVDKTHVLIVQKHVLSPCDMMLLTHKYARDLAHAILKAVGEE